MRGEDEVGEIKKDLSIACATEKGRNKCNNCRSEKLEVAVEGCTELHYATLFWAINSG